MIPEKLKGFMCYDDGEKMIGVADVTLPSFAAMTDTIGGAGILGEIDTPAVGNFGSMTTTINWRSLVEENVIYIAPNTYQFDFRGSVQIYDQNGLEFGSRAVKVVMKAIPKTVNLGSFSTASTMGASGEFELIYILITIEGRPMVELDKLSYKFIVNGVDYTAKLRQDIGLS